MLDMLQLKIIFRICSAYRKTPTNTEMYLLLAIYYWSLGRGKVNSVWDKNANRDKMEHWISGRPDEQMIYQYRKLGKKFYPTSERLDKEETQRSGLSPYKSVDRIWVFQLLYPQIKVKITQIVCIVGLLITQISLLNCPRWKISINKMNALLETMHNGCYTIIINMLVNIDKRQIIKYG